MTTVADANTIILIIALLIGIAVGWWMFRSARHKSAAVEKVDADGSLAPPAVPPQPEAATPATRGIDTPEGNGLVDQGAAATGDVAGEVLGVQVHGELPGASGPPDNLQMLKGVGPKLAQKLNESGITRFEQLARLSPNEVDMLEDKLGPFKGRLSRDRVVEQASYLARGDRDGFEARFGNLGSSTPATPLS